MFTLKPISTRLIFARSILAVFLGTTAFVNAGFADGKLDQEIKFDPPVRAPSVAAPRASGLTFNGTRLDFDRPFYIDFPVDGGQGRNTVAGGEITYSFGSKAQQQFVFGTVGSRIETNQQSWVFQLRAVDRHRTVTRTIEEQGRLLGFNLDLSVTGKCILPSGENTPDDYCTYTPGLATVPGGYDADTLAPTAFQSTTSFGQVIPFEVHESLKEQGFQRGAAVTDDGLVGLSFDAPNSGFIANDGAAANAVGTRDEQLRRGVVLSLARIDETLQSNSIESAATRTIRAFVLPDADEIGTEFMLMQLATWLLPAASPTVAFTEGNQRTSVSNNISLALSNARIPANSFTMFQTGRAEVLQSTTPPRSAAETPVASYMGVWMGMSAVRAIAQTSRMQFIPTGDRVSVNEPVFLQGGGDTPFQDFVDLGITLFDQIDQSISQVNFQNIDDLFVQVGVDVTTQEALRRMTFTENTDYTLVPHLVVSGNRTGGEYVLRYYSGVILGDEHNAYVGADYTLNTESGWNAFARADVYSNPDQDYASQAELRGSRTFTMSPQRQITLGAGAVAALDNVNGPSSSEIGLDLAENDMRADFVGRWREGPVDLTIRQRFLQAEGDEDWRDSTTIGFGYAAGNRFSLTAEYTPLSSEDSYIEGLVGMNYRMGSTTNAPVLQAQFARARYDIGATSTGQRLTTTDNIFRAGFQLRF